MKTTTRFTKFAAAALLSAAIVPFAADAGNGNNGKGNGNGNGNVSENRNERGQTARNLGPLNAARANENAFLNAAANRNIGQIDAYRTTALETSALITEQNDAAATLLELQALTEEEILALYPNGDYEEVLAAATQDYLDATADAEASVAEIEQFLRVLSGIGR